MVLGFLGLIACTAALAAGSAAAAGAVYGVGRGRRTAIFVGASIIAQAIIVASVHALGMLSVLSVYTLAPTVIVVAAGLAFASLRHAGGAGPFAYEQRALWGGWLRWPRDIVRACRYAGLPLWPVVVMAVGVVAYLTFSACFSPARGNNDALFYHEPIVAMTLQHGHLGPYALPDHLQRINGMPRFVHFVQLWFAAFTGRELTELPQVFALGLGALATYGLTRRLGVQKSAAMAWGLLWTVTPGMVRLSCGIMVDVTSGAWVMAAAWAVLSPSMTVARAFVAAFAVALTVGTKYHVVVVSFVLAVALLVRILQRRGAWSPRAFALTVGGCASVVLAGVGLVFVRNWVLFDNPIWPAGVRLPAVGVKLASAHDLKDVTVSGKAIGLWDQIVRWFTGPFSKRPWQGGSARPEDYGDGGRYIVWPLALLGVAKVSVALIKAWRAKQKIDPRLASAAACAAIVLVAVASFPAFVRGRYYLVAWGVFIALAAWTQANTSLRSRGRLLVFVATVMTMSTLVWSTAKERHWLPYPSSIGARLEVPRSERHYTHRHLSTIHPAMGTLRTEEMTAGKVLAFDTGMYSIGILWNDDYSNIVRWVSGDASRKAHKIGADWLFLHRRTIKDPEARGFVDLGPVLKRRHRRPGRMYRVVKPPPPAQR